MFIVNWFNTNQGFSYSLLSLLTLFFSIIAIVIAIQTTRKQSKIALFDRRRKVFINIQDIVRKLVNQGFNSINEFDSFSMFSELSNIKDEVYFLFDKEIHTYLLQLINDAIDVLSIDKSEETRGKTLEKLVKQIEKKELRSKLNKYIGLQSL